MKNCKQCGVRKRAGEFYRHPLTSDGRLAKCKTCVTEGRKTERERIMARESDKRRNQKEKRKRFTKERQIRFRKKYPEKRKAENMVSNFFRKFPDLKPKSSSISGEIGLVHMHHVDYSMPNVVIPCTPMEHSKMHRGLIRPLKKYRVSLPF